ncbi:gliding motility-associated C-terminal domain-containing protein [Flavobacterium poyangense]|uniref:gliding motility-associated C-terminal domain-containing protein n=1 Tax=Flavobacterium poyangense TaxID=2204302 RepID=UPI0014201C35|nr:gliding motility-associated C-terminal domain-containing protein [Flavobacterium sp. JXAS1]
MKKRINILFLVIFVHNANLKAQIVNIGELTILPGTVMSSKFNFENSFSGTLINDGELVLFSDFNNDGLVFFTDNENSYTKFIGKKNQKISSSSSAEFTKFNNLLFDNASKQPAFEVSGNISISGSSDFRKGIVNTSKHDGSIVYEKNAGHSNVNNESHIEGYIEKVGNTDFIYPIGANSHYRHAKIIPTTASVKTVIRGKYFFENSNLLYPHSSKVGNLEQIDDKEYWEIENRSGKPEVMITLSWDQETTSEFIYKNLQKSKTDAETITIVRWDKDKKIWVDEGGVVEIGSNTITTFSDVSGFGVFALARTKRNTKDDGYVFVYNAVSPNDDGKNDYFKIDGIQNHPNNSVIIYNRWGVKVFEITNYDSKGNVFNGYSQSQGRSAANNDSALPPGTYFYVLNYEVKIDGTSKNMEKVGYLYLSGN